MINRAIRFARHTLAFERMAATELRLLARQAPAVAQHLDDLANKLDEHADEAKLIAEPEAVQPHEHQAP